jgi:hypothetical protein
MKRERKSISSYNMIILGNSATTVPYLASCHGHAPMMDYGEEVMGPPNEQVVLRERRERGERERAFLPVT